MHIVFLRFSENTSKAAELMPAHNAWVAKGLADGVFLLVGSLQTQRGGAIIAHGEAREALAARVAADPFVREKVVTAEILEVAPAKADRRLEFLMAESA